MVMFRNDYYCQETRHSEVLTLFFFSKLLNVLQTALASLYKWIRMIDPTFWTDVINFWKANVMDLCLYGGSATPILSSTVWCVLNLENFDEK